MSKPYSKKFAVKTPIGDPTDYWVRCGTAYENAKSGKITIHLDTVPVRVNKNGKLVMVLFDSEDETDGY